MSRIKFIVCRGLALCGFVVVLGACASSGDARVEAAETHYADFLDAAGARDTIDSGLTAQFSGLGRAGWQARYEASLSALQAAFAAADAGALSPLNTRALAAMRAGIAYREDSSLAPVGDCDDAERGDATGADLRRALYACFSSVGDSITFEDRVYARTAALQTLEQLGDAGQRRGLFLAMAPLWRAVNGNDEPSSPYRRLIGLEAERARGNIARAEASIGLAPGEAEVWLIAALEAWGEADSARAIEPWDFRYSYAAAARALEQCAPADAVRAADDRFFADLGADLDALGVIQDIDSRPGMSPVDYADFARIGREVDGAWRPAIPRLSIIMQQGGLGLAAQLAHENGHTVHYAAMRARPSLLLPDDLTLAVEAFADITGWSVYAPAWQQRYLGCAADAAENRRARLGAVMLDVAWGLFELRMSRDPDADPNAVWTDITSRYLHITPHPELSWWAVRGQLVDEPGYMIHYALGAFVTAAVRARIDANIGAFDAGNPRWFGYVSERLYRYGGERAPAELLEDFLGGPVRPEALLEDISGL